MWAWVEVVREVGERVLSAVVRATVIQPFTRLYLHGPAVLGFWGGLPRPNVCARLTRTDSNFWVQTAETERECQQTIDREIDAWLTVIAAAVYCCSGYMLLMTAASRFCRAPPAAAPVLVIKNLPMASIDQRPA
jgi:hypothetical protein